MLCKKCNTHNDGAHRFCISCKSRLNLSYEESEKDIVVAPLVHQKRNKDTNKKGIIAGYLIFVTIIIVVAYIIYLSFFYK